MRYAITYMKVKKNKQGVLEFEGPTVGPVVPSMLEAQERTKSIVQNFRNVAVFPKIIPIPDDYTVAGVLEQSQQYYNILKRTILESKQITDRPVKRSK